MDSFTAVILTIGDNPVRVTLGGAADSVTVLERRGDVQKFRLTPGMTIQVEEAQPALPGEGE